jgi:hypothetical protein
MLALIYTSLLNTVKLSSSAARMAQAMASSVPRS